MNGLTTDEKRLFYYTVSSLWESVKMKSSYIHAIQTASVNLDKQIITNDDELLFNDNLQRVINDVFFHVSVLAKDIENSVGKANAHEETGLPEPSPLPPTMESGSLWAEPTITIKLEMPENWNENLLNSVDSSINDLLIHNMMMKIYRDRGQMELFANVRDIYDGLTSSIKSLINYRNTAPKKTYRFF